MRYLMRPRVNFFDELMGLMMSADRRCIHHQIQPPRRDIPGPLLLTIPFDEVHKARSQDPSKWRKVVQLGNFSEHQISVRTKDRTVKVEAKKTVGCGGNSMIKRVCCNFTLPDNVDKNSMRTFLQSDGNLILEATLANDDKMEDCTSKMGRVCTKTKEKQQYIDKDNQKAQEMQNILDTEQQVDTSAKDITSADYTDVVKGEKDNTKDVDGVSESHVMEQENIVDTSLEDITPVDQAQSVNEEEDITKSAGDDYHTHDMEQECMDSIPVEDISEPDQHVTEQKKSGDIDALESDNIFVHEISINGFDPESMSVTLSGNELILRAEKEITEEDCVIRKQMVRSLTLPQAVNPDSVECKIDGDKLSVVAEKRQQLSRTIPIVKN